jgi:hypothetical protein
MHVEVQVDLGDIELSDYDDYPKYLHDRDAEAVHIGRLRADLEVMFEGYEDISITKSTPQGLSVNILPESQAQFDAWTRSEEEESDRLFDAMNAVTKELNIKKCIWSFMPRDYSYEGDYRQMLVDNPTFIEADCRFSYPNGWNDDETLVHPGLFACPNMHDIFLAADHLLRMSNDDHHVFVEGVILKGVDSDGVHMYDFYFGS